MCSSATSRPTRISPTRSGISRRCGAWGQITEAKPDSWYVETAAKVYRPDLYLQAARLLVKEGKAKASDFPWDSDGYRAPQAGFIDGAVFDGHRPNEYLAQFAIGLKRGQRIENGRLVTSGH
jgi:nitrate/nitrite transport system substrate-binding protein